MKSKAIIPVTKISLGNKPNPRFNLDEDNLPPEYTPVVLLNDDFGQDIELSDSPGKDTTTSVKTIVEQTSNTKDLPRYNAPIEGLLPGTSSSKLPNKTISVSPPTLSPVTTLNSSFSKGSPFTRFLASDTPHKRKPVTKTTAGDRISTDYSDPVNSPDTPKDTGYTRLERFLTEAAEEASSKLQKSSFTLDSETPPEPAATTRTMGNAEKDAIPARKIVSEQKDDDRSTPSDSVSESDMDLSSGGEANRTAEKPLKRRKKENKSVSTGKRAKPRPTLSGWMYHKYPILKFFATAPADAARYPHKYRCRVCLVELSLKTKDPLEILHHYRTDAHLVKEHRIRMETPGLPLYDKNCDELTGMPLKYAKERAKREYPVALKLGEYFLRIEQLEEPGGPPKDLPNKEGLSQLNLIKFGLVH